jgi:hypothetical protein
VLALARAAPPLARWQIIQFRPRQGPTYCVEVGGDRVDPKDVQFSPLDNADEPLLSVHPRSEQKIISRCKQIGYLLLDHGLGEYDVEMRLGLIKMLAPGPYSKANATL